MGRLARCARELCRSVRTRWKRQGSVNLCLGESTLYRPEPPELNQFVLRLEDLNELLVQEGSLDERRRDPAQAAQVAQSINTLITESRTKRTDAEEKSVSSFKDLVKLGLKDPVSPDAARLKSLTEALNIIRRDRRPSFIAFDAEFGSLDQDNDWLVQFCERCGLSRHFAGYPKVLALFRYKVEVVTSVAGGRPVFAAPTVLDHSFSPGFFPAPAGVSFGYAVALTPQADRSHLAPELVHARIDYAPEHWVRVGVLNRPAFDYGMFSNLRATHLECLRLRTGKHAYGGLPP